MSRYKFIRRINNLLSYYCSGALTKHELWGWIYSILETQKEEADIGLVLLLMNGSGTNAIAPNTSLSRFFINEILKIDTSTPIKLFWSYGKFEYYPYATEAICQWRNNRNLIKCKMKKIYYPLRNPCRVARLSFSQIFKSNG